MKRFLFLIAVLVPLVAFGGDPNLGRSSDDADLAAHFGNLDLAAAKKQADFLLTRNPVAPIALFVRMEVAELEAQPDVVLDSALRLCNSALPENISRIASGRILEYAGNSRAFNAVLKRVRSAAAQQGGCAAKLNLALVLAAADGDPNLDLQQATVAAGVLTRWRIAGRFGHYSNADFDVAWPPESDHFSQTNYAGLQAEEFSFADGAVTLPDYFSASGVFYAATDVMSDAGNSVFEVLSSGPYAIFVDGRLALKHDSRFAVAASTDAATLALTPGKHRVVVKFTSEATPFRVLVHRAPKLAVQAFDEGLLKSYIEGLVAYFREDMLTLQRLAASGGPQVMEYLRALLYSSIDHPSEARDAWESLKPAPLARIKLAEMAAGQNSRNSAADYGNIGTELQDSEAAQQAAFAWSGSLDSLRRLVALHPSCAHLAQARKILASSGDLEAAAQLQQQLAACAPESLDYAAAVSAQGKHQDSAQSLEKLLVLNPLHRAARRMLVRELLLDNQRQQAAEQARRLHEIAPNSVLFAQIAASPERVLDSTSGRAAGFTQQNQFYVPYRRNGLEIIQRSASRHFSGGPAVTLLFDKVVQIQNDGSISVYTHLVTRLLNKDGIARLGEVYVPRGADLLELRTIKSNAQDGGAAVAEPELVQQKSTISMPALEPGDNIEEEFVVHYASWDEAPEDVAMFTFGSFTAPILYSRFVVTAPEKLPLKIIQENGAAEAKVEHVQGNIVRTWERNDIAQTAQENDQPLDNELPFVAVIGGDDPSARLRDDLIAATRIGPEVTRIAKSLQQNDANEAEKARRLYRFVTSKIESAEAEWSANNAEDTLLNREGSRTAALLALARALGLKTELVLAHNVGRTCGRNTLSGCYATPLVRFFFPSGKTVDTDAESPAPFGAIPFGLDTQDALLVPLLPTEKQPLHVALTANPDQEKSVAEAELFLDDDGSMAVDLRIRLGAARSQQVRNALPSGNEAERQAFFDQLATRVFPTATQVRGSAANLDDPEGPLELRIRCHVPQIVPAGGPGDLDQLAPGLGLRELYAKNSARRLPLYIDAVLFESTTFHLHLPPGFQVHSLPANFSARNNFGDYSVEFKSEERMVTIRREFRIPVQVISQDNYKLFTDFARQIEEAERGKIKLSVTRQFAGR
jgi:hypothetical protein